MIEGERMSNQIDQLNEWLADLDSKHPAEWDMLPDIGLYMDQVQTYIDRQLGLYRRDEKDRLLTPAMINNYIKDSLIPRAESKKYTPVHLALLILIGTLKQVMSIPNLNQMLTVYREPADVAALYNHYREIQRASLLDIASQVLSQTEALQKEKDGPKADTSAALRNLALELSIEARTRILIAEKILALLALPAAVDASAKETEKKPVAVKKETSKKGQSK